MKKYNYNYLYQPDGILITGGIGDDNSGVPMKSVEIFDIYNHYYKVNCLVTDMKNARSEHTMSNMEGGDFSRRSRKLACGGHGGGGRTCEEFTYDIRAWRDIEGKWDILNYELSQSYIGHAAWSYIPKGLFKDYNYLMLLGGQNTSNPDKVYTSSLAYNDARTRPWGKGRRGDNEYEIDQTIHPTIR